MIQSPLINEETFHARNGPTAFERDTEQVSAIGTACLKMYDTHVVESMGGRIALQNALLESVLEARFLLEV